MKQSSEGEAEPESVAVRFSFLVEVGDVARYPRGGTSHPRTAATRELPRSAKDMAPWERGVGGGRASGLKASSRDTIKNNNSNPKREMFRPTQLKAKRAVSAARTREPHDPEKFTRITLKLNPEVSRMKLFP